MSQSQIDWDEEIPYDPEDEYQALLRALRRKRGFGLYFVECSPQKGSELIASLRTDLPQTKFQVLSLDRSSTTLYDKVADLWQQAPFDVLFIQGLEYALLEYEDTKRLAGWTSKEIYSYSWKGVPRILSHLNQQRERFRDNFECRFVFLVPPFVIKYFIQRAPDFFDWRSGLFTFANLSVPIESILNCILESRNFNYYIQLTPAERTEKLLALDDTLSHQSDLTIGEQAELWREKGLLLYTANDYKAALSCYDKAIAYEPEYYYTWFFRGVALSSLNQDEEAVRSFDQAFQHGLENPIVWELRAISLQRLGRYEESILSCDKAIESQPNSYRAWFLRGINLLILKRYKSSTRKKSSNH